MARIHPQGHRHDGTRTSLAAYAGSVLLIVNVASTVTPQYAGLEQLWRTHRKRGLVVLGFPATSSATRNRATPAEIADFCATTHDVTFPLFAKIEVNGDKTPAATLSAAEKSRTGPAPAPRRSNGTSPVPGRSTPKAGLSAATRRSPSRRNSKWKSSACCRADSVAGQAGKPRRDRSSASSTASARRSRSASRRAAKSTGVVSPAPA